ncbi:ABC transporter permease [Nonomuraea sp. NPDC050790]|uniref:ABC transporter permease n=1 Tax=Nonomuraea sp. NPDC050790 TaxID=3364371 RepID=UPI00379C2580
MKLAAVEVKLLVREPGSMFTILIPLFIMVIFGGVGDSALLPMALTISVGLVSLYLLPTTLATYRERGILRRLSTTPVRPGSLLGVQLGLQFVLAVVAAGVLLAVAGALPMVSAVLVFALGTAAMFAIGLLIAALAPNGRTANGVGVLLYFPMAYLAGLIQPVSQMPALLAEIGQYTPMGAFRQALQDAWSGAAPAPLPLVVMAASALVVSIVAAKLFRWE